MIVGNPNFEQFRAVDWENIDDLPSPEETNINTDLGMIQTKFQHVGPQLIATDYADKLMMVRLYQMINRELPEYTIYQTTTVHNSSMMIMEFEENWRKFRYILENYPRDANLFWVSNIYTGSKIILIDWKTRYSIMMKLNADCEAINIAKQRLVARLEQIREGHLPEEDLA